MRRPQQPKPLKASMVGVRATYPTPISPSGRYAHETPHDRFKRQREDPRSPGGVLAPENLVTREKLLINKGKRNDHCSGLPGKLYNRYDFVGPAVDSMKLMYYKMGWAVLPPDIDDWENANRVSLIRPVASIDEQMHTLGYGPAPSVPATPRILCKGCRSTNPHDFMPTADRSHMVCKCGVVCAPIHVSTDREKNCAADEDKTAHADKPYEPRTDRFDHPALSCEEQRKQREREVLGTRVSKNAKQKYGLGWAHEHNMREAARAERQRQEMEPRDQTKSAHIQIELDKLFTPLEPVDAQIKRYCRMEADRMWREAVRHSNICCAKTRCQLRIKEKGPAVIADAVLSCSLNTLLEGHRVLDGVTHAGLLVIADKLGARQSAKGTSCALRAVRTIVATYLSHEQPDPIESCPAASCSVASCQSSPSPSSSSAASAPHPNAPFARTDSSVSDVGDVPGRELLQLRDRVCDVFRHFGTAMPNSVRDATLRAIQDSEFRATLAVAQADDSDVGNLAPDGLCYVLLESIAQQQKHAGRRHVPPRLLASFAATLPRLEAAIETVKALLPECATRAPAVDEGDGLFG